MKICVFTENYYKGGLDTFLVNLFNAWPDGNDDFTLVCNSNHPGLETIAARTIVTIERYSRLFTSSVFMGLSEKKFTQWYLLKLFFRILYRILEYLVLFPWYCLSLCWYFRRSDYDRLMVVNGGYPASLLCRSAAIAWRLAGKQARGLFNFHNSASPPAWYASYPENLIDKWVLDASSHMVTVSKNCLDSLESRVSFKGSPKLKYIYNGISDPNPSLISKEQLSGSGRGEKDMYCLMLATYEPRKGHFYLFDAFKRIIQEFPYVRLLIYGFGLSEQKRLIMDRVKHQSLENNVVLNDFTSQTADLIANARVLVVPSQTQESFGLTIIEAMASGTPVVTTDVGGMPEVLSGCQCGYVCSKDSPEEFANAVKCILGDSSLANEMSSNGRKTFEDRFTAQKMASQYEMLVKLD